MPLLNREVEITDFIKFTSGGVQIADFDQVHAALVKRYKEIYGTDIDLSGTAADGVFVYSLSLIINNILQSFKNMYSNLSVETASGIYLDELCKLSNVYRKPETFSRAVLHLTADGESVTVAPGTEFVDYAGVVWRYEGASVTVTPGQPATQITVVCAVSGDIRADSGWIYQTLEPTALIVLQPSAAAEGQREETDSQLRARRAQSTGASGTTVLESLVGALLSAGGIRDVKVYNNNYADNATADDGTTIPLHNIYVVLRYLDNVTVNDEDIGRIIYEKITPGIATTPTACAAANGDAKVFSYIPELHSEQIEWLSNNVYWKRAKPVSPSFTITIHPYGYFSDSTYDLIKEAVINYMNELPISAKPTVNDLIINAIYADPQFKGSETYGVTGATLPYAANAKNPDTYYHYTTIARTGTTDVTITFS